MCRLEEKDLDLEEKDLEEDEDEEDEDEDEEDEPEKKIDLEDILFTEERDYLIDKQGNQVNTYVCVYICYMYNLLSLRPSVPDINY